MYSELGQDCKKASYGGGVFQNMDWGRNERVDIDKWSCAVGNHRKIKNE